MVKCTTHGRVPFYLSKLMEFSDLKTYTNKSISVCHISPTGKWASRDFMEISMLNVAEQNKNRVSLCFYRLLTRLQGVWIQSSLYLQCACHKPRGLGHLSTAWQSATGLHSYSLRALSSALRAASPPTQGPVPLSPDFSQLPIITPPSVGPVNWRLFGKIHFISNNNLLYCT